MIKKLFFMLYCKLGFKLSALLNDLGNTVLIHVTIQSTKACKCEECESNRIKILEAFR